MPYTYVGTYVEYLENGEPLVFGDVIDTPDQRLIDLGRLVPTDAPTPDPEPAPVIADTTTTEELGVDASRI